MLRPAQYALYRRGGEREALVVAAHRAPQHARHGDAAERRVHAAERRAAKNASSAAVTSSQVEPPIASSEVADAPAPNLEALASLLAGKEMTEEERLKIVAPLMQSLQKIMPNAMQASAVKQFVEWMHLKIGADALFDLAIHSEPARVEEYKARIMKWPVDANGTRSTAIGKAMTAASFLSCNRRTWS